MGRGAGRGDRVAARPRRSPPGRVAAVPRRAARPLQASEGRRDRRGPAAQRERQGRQAPVARRPVGGRPGLRRRRAVAGRRLALRETITQALFIAKVCSGPALLLMLPVGVLLAVSVGSLAGRLGAGAYSGAFVGVGQAAALVCALMLGGSAICADLGSRTIRERTRRSPGSNGRRRGSVSRSRTSTACSAGSTSSSATSPWLWTASARRSTGSTGPSARSSGSWTPPIGCSLRSPRSADSCPDGPREQCRSRPERGTAPRGRPAPRSAGSAVRNEETRPEGSLPDGCSVVSIGAGGPGRRIRADAWNPVAPGRP
ncbi:YrbE family protein [Rhodococcus ruber BKS 20-38]|uniref:YrbE family protein n=1 Tax=Rhodococcus ruber BKS 20-38 TaxID=1278076 RepID=M2XZF8_9NOCA|nr:YrbE family protein [Rhodococcus ruber BKS 20-38]